MRKNKYRLLNKAAYHLDKANHYLNESQNSELGKVLKDALNEIFKIWKEVLF